MKRKDSALDNPFGFWEIDNKNILEMECTCPACPVQFEGKLKDGTFFYFRERHEWTRFAIAKTQKEAYTANDKDALYYVTLPEGTFSSVAAQDISKWVDDYFKSKKEESAFRRVNAKEEE